MDKPDIELANAFELNFSQITDITQTSNPIKLQDFADYLNELVSFEVSKHDANLLITQYSIERKLVGQEYYLLISAK